LFGRDNKRFKQAIRIAYIFLHKLSLAMKNWQKRTKRDINFYAQGVRKSGGKLRQEKKHF
jgi:hypothetical protein